MPIYHATHCPGESALNTLNTEQLIMKSFRINILIKQQLHSFSVRLEKFFLLVEIKIFLFSQEVGFFQEVDWII